jgi:imidazolonepropionase-like amidohydrolase
MRQVFLACVLAAAGLAASAASAAPNPYVAPLKIAPRPDHWTLIHAGTLMVDPARPLLHNATIVVKNGKIDAVRPGLVTPESLKLARQQTTVVDMARQFVMAGLIDAHAHIAWPWGGKMPSMTQAAEQARLKLLGGATSIRDAGSLPEIIFPLRDLINAGYIVGPRILASGAPITTTGGHGDWRNGNFIVELNDKDRGGGVCDGVESCQHATRRQIMLGADNIKIMATAGVMDDSDTGLDQQFTTPELVGIVDAAHLMKRKVLAHTIGRIGIRAAVDAGVDSIEHGSFLDDETADIMRRKNIFLVPILVTPEMILDDMRNSDGEKWSENTKHKIQRVPDTNPATQGQQVRMALKHGVKIGVGTDLPNPVGEELIILVRKCGMTPLQVLTAATVDNAELLGIQQIAGTIEAGKSADIVAFDGNPIERIEDTLKIRYVMAAGLPVGVVPIAVKGQPSVDE